MKSTKKIIGLIMALMLLLTFMLTACNDNKDPSSTPASSDPKATTTTATDPTGTLTLTVTPAEVEIYAGDEEFQLLFGVVASDESASIYVSEDGGFDIDTAGTYVVTYTATLGDLTATATRTITVLEALSDLTLEVVKNNMTAGKWEGVLMTFKNAQYYELSEDYTTTEALTGVFKNTSDKDIVVSLGGKMGEAAIIDANGVVVEGRDGANGRLVNAENPIRTSAPTGATLTVNGEEVVLAENFAKVMTVPAGGYVIVVQTGAFGSGFDFDGRGFICQSVIHQIGTVIRLYWADTNEELTTYANQKPVVSGNGKVLAVLGDTSFNLDEAVLAGLKATDDNGTFGASDDVEIGEFTIVDNGGFDINTPGLYTVKLSVTDGELTTEFTREVEVKSDGVGILTVGSSENKYYVSMDRVKFNEEISKLGDIAFVIYTNEFTGNLLENGWGIAFVMDEYGTLVRIYDGANAKYYDAENAAGIQDSNKVTSAGYLAEAFASLQDGETLLAAINNPSTDNAHRGFLGSGVSKIIGNKVSGLDMEFGTEPNMIIIGENSFEVAPELIAIDKELTDKGSYAFIVYTSNYTGELGFADGYGQAIVVDKNGVVVRVYDGFSGKYFDAENPWPGVQDKEKCDAGKYLAQAFASLQDGETLIVAPSTYKANAEGSGKFLYSCRISALGANVSGLGLTFGSGENEPSEGGDEKEETPSDKLTLTIGANSFEVDPELVAIDKELTEKGNYAFIVYTSNYTGELGYTDGYGQAIVVDKNGVVVRVYDGFSGKYFDAENPWPGVQDKEKCDAGQYLAQAFASLQDGETLIVAPSTYKANAEGSGKFLYSCRNSLGAIVSGLGLTFEEK